MFWLETLFKPEGPGFLPTRPDVGPDIMNLWTHLREAFWRGKPRKMICYVARRVFVVQQWCVSTLKPAGEKKKEKTHRVLFQQQKRRVWNNDSLRVSFNSPPLKKNFSVCNDKIELLQTGTARLLWELIYFGPKVQLFELFRRATALKPNIAGVH